MNAENKNENDIQDHSRRAAQAIDVLAPEQIPGPTSKALDPKDDFLDRVWSLVVSLAEGDITPGVFEERLGEVVADEVDIPYVPGPLEERAVGLVVDGIKAVLVALVRS